MKLYCPSCNILTADVRGRIRKGGAVVCRKCMEKFKIADEMAQMAQKAGKSINRDMPDFMKGLF